MPLIIINKGTDPPLMRDCPVFKQMFRKRKLYGSHAGIQLKMS